MMMVRETDYRGTADSSTPGPLFTGQRSVQSLLVRYDPLQLSMPHQPGIMVIHLLNQCNLFCRHCFMAATSRVDKILGKDLVLRSLREVEQLGIGRVHLTGGEPFMYPYLSEVLSFISQQQEFVSAISTNGTLIDESWIGPLSDSKITVNVSIDGPEDYHDKFRGSKGAFLKANENIKLMLDAKIPVSVVTTVCQDNLEYLPWLANWASEMGIKNVTIQPLLHLGRASAISDKKLSQIQICDMFFLLSDLCHAYRSKGVGFGLAYRNRDYLLEHPCAAYVCNGNKCHRNVAKEIKKLIIREDGTVLPEVETLNPRFSLGNLNEGKLVDLVNEYFEYGYSNFHELCRLAYTEILSKWSSPIVPWNEIISEESWKQEENIALKGTLQ
jgi:MoaA/NifB/PqqE/SkfB family radical SAM enzyme